jgi:hypothetical protein
MSIGRQELHEGLTHLIQQHYDIQTQALDDFLALPKFTLYLNVPIHITRYLDHFSISYPPQQIAGVLGTYFLWLKLADDEIDEHLKTGEDIFRRLSSGPDESFNNNEPGLDMLTDILYYASKPSSTAFLEEFSVCRRYAVLETEAVNIRDLAQIRTMEGEMLSLATLSLIEPYIQYGDHSIYDFLPRVGRLGMLLDSMIDLREDSAAGELKFQPGMLDMAYLAMQFMKGTLQIQVHYPFMCTYYIGRAFKLPGCILREKAKIP